MSVLPSGRVSRSSTRAAVPPGKISGRPWGSNRGPGLSRTTPSQRESSSCSSRSWTSGRNAGSTTCSYSSVRWKCTTLGRGTRGSRVPSPAIHDIDRNDSTERGWASSTRLGRDLLDGGSQDGPRQPAIQLSEVATIQDLLPLRLADGDTARFQDLENGLRSSPDLSSGFSPDFSPDLAFRPRPVLPSPERRVAFGGQSLDHRVVGHRGVQQSRHRQRFHQAGILDLRVRRQG